jgi:RimJ/RimL family protein N-acetyltransferase
MIEGTKINLRAIEEDDAVLFHRWFNDPEVTRFLGANAFPALSLAQEHAWIQSLRDSKSRKNYTIVLKDGTPIGNCDLRKFDWTARSCEVGIAIGEKAYWGQGYGGEALQLLLQIAFDSLNLHKVWLTCAAYNERGLRTYLRLGFAEDGRLRDARFLDGRYHDTVVMSILEDEWRERQQE